MKRISKRVLSIVLTFLIVSGLVSALAVSVSAASKPVAIVEDLNLTPYEGEYGEIKIKVLGAENVKYQWQGGFFKDDDSSVMEWGAAVDLPEGDVYCGTQTNHFKLLALNSLDELEWRCKITYDGGTIYTQKFYFTFIEREYLSGCSVDALEIPDYGKNPDFDLDISESPGEYTAGDVRWFQKLPDGNLSELSKSSVFYAGDYLLRVYFIPARKYKFGDFSAVYVNDVKYRMTIDYESSPWREFYVEVPFTVEDKSYLEGALKFDWKFPRTAEGSQFIDLGKIYLGTKSMDINFAFEAKELFAEAISNGYYVRSETAILKDGQGFYKGTGKSYNLKNITEPGKYLISQCLYLYNSKHVVEDTVFVWHTVEVVDPEVISELSASVLPPVVGKSQPMASSTTDGAYVYKTEWSEISSANERLLADDETFEEGKTYECHVTFKPKEDYAFADKITGTINGSSASSYGNHSWNESSVNIRYTATSIPNPFYFENSDWGKSEEDIIKAVEYTLNEDGSTYTATVIVDVDCVDGQLYYYEVESMGYWCFDTDNKLDYGVAYYPMEKPAKDEYKIVVAKNLKPDKEWSVKMYLANDQYADSELQGYDFSWVALTTPSLPNAEITGLLGDADCDSKVNVKDATAIQKHIAGLITLSETGMKLADVDNNKNVNIKDATAIQKHIAGMNTGFDIGKDI